MKMKWDLKNIPKKAELVEMSPMEYLSKTPSPCAIPGHTADMDIDVKDCFSKSSLDYLEKKAERGEPFDPLMLDYQRTWFGRPGHEGRHRALVALRLGEKTVPVVVYKA